jgi:hypothetical protein
MAQSAALAKQAGLDEQQTAGPDMTKVLREFDPLLRGIAAVAQGDNEPRAQIEAVLTNLEEKGWHLSAPVQRIWAGERDEAALTAGLDDQDTQLVRRVLELVQLPADSQPAESTRDQVLASLPPAVRAAIEAGDVQAANAALAQLPREQAAAIVQQLRAAGMIG